MFSIYRLLSEQITLIQSQSMSRYGKEKLMVSLETCKINFHIVF